MGKCISVCKCLLSRWYLIYLWKAQGENSCHQLTGFSLSVSTLQAQEGQEYGWFLKEPYSCSSFWSTEEKMCINTLTNTHMYVCVCRISMFQFLLHKSPCARPQHSIFSLYLIPILYYPYYVSDCSSCIYLREAAMLTDIARISKSHRRKYYNSAGNGVTHLSADKGWLYCMLSLWALLSMFLTFGCVFLCSQSFKEVRSQCLK